MPEVPGDQFKVVIDRCRRNLKIRISKNLPCLLQLRRQESTHLSNSHIIGQHGHSSENTFPDIRQMALPRGEAASKGKKIFLCGKVRMELYSGVSFCVGDLL